MGDLDTPRPMTAQVRTENRYTSILCCLIALVCGLVAEKSRGLIFLVLYSAAVLRYWGDSEVHRTARVQLARMLSSACLGTGN